MRLRRYCCTPLFIAFKLENHLPHADTRVSLHSALHCIQTLLARRIIADGLLLHSALHCIQTQGLRDCKDTSCDRLHSALHCIQTWLDERKRRKTCEVALRSSLHSNILMFCMVSKAFCMVALRSSLHSNNIHPKAVSDCEISCTPLFIAFKQGGLLRSFSKRGEHTASERGMHLEC